MITKDGENWEPTHEQLIKWEYAYHPVDIHRELAKMEAWLDANPTRRKTARGMARFCTTWLGRASVQGETVRRTTSTRDTTLEEDLNDRSWAQ